MNRTQSHLQSSSSGDAIQADLAYLRAEQNLQDTAQAAKTDTTKEPEEKKLMAIAVEKLSKKLHAYKESSRVAVQEKVSKLRDKENCQKQYHKTMRQRTVEVGFADHLYHITKHSA